MGKETIEIRVEGRLSEGQRAKILALLEHESLYNPAFSGLDLTSKLVECCEFTEIDGYDSDPIATTQLLSKVVAIVDNFDVLVRLNKEGRKLLEDFIEKHRKSTVYFNLDACEQEILGKDWDFNLPGGSVTFELARHESTTGAVESLDLFREHFEIDQATEG